MGQHIRWQAIITIAGIGIMLLFLTFVAFNPAPEPKKMESVITTVKGGRYIEAVAGLPQFINPLLATYNQADRDLVALIFNGLTEATVSGDIQPDLAENWEVSEDGLAYLFTLRDDILWHDGQPFTADDVLFTIGLMKDENFPGAPYLQGLWRQVGVEKVNDYLIRFTLNEPLPTFLNYTTIGILPAHLYQGTPAEELLTHETNLAPIGTGPFRLDDINTEYARLSPNPFYSRTKPSLEGIEFRFYPSYEETLSAYQQGEVLGGTIPTLAVEVAHGIDGLEIYNAQESSYVVVYLNLQEAETLSFFQEIELRQALLLGLNRQVVVDKALYGQGVVAPGPIAPWSWAFNPIQPTTSYDIEKARTLLDRTGWIDTDGDDIRERSGQILAFTMLSSDDPLKIAVASEVQAQWRALGVGVEVEIVPNLSERLEARDYQVALAEIAFFGDPDPYPLWHVTQAETGQNFGGWSNRQASALLEKARITIDKGERNDAYYQFQRIFAEEIPAFILYYPVYTYGVSEEVKGVQLAPLVNPADRFRNIEDWYLLTERSISPQEQPQQ